MSTTKKRAQDLENRLIEYAVLVCYVVEALPSTPLGKHVSNQLFRSATSPAPNYGEAQAAESKKDFVHKMRICLKELREAHIWIRFIERMALLPPESLKEAIRESNELIAIFVTSIKTASRGM